MKLTQQEAIDLLGSVGIADVQLVEEGSEYDQSAALTSIDNARMAIIKPKVQKEIYDSEKAKVMSIAHDTITKAIKKLTGVDAEKVNGLEKYEDVIAAGIDHVKSLTGKDKDELQSHIDSILLKHNAALDAEKNKNAELEKVWQSKWSDREIQAYIQNEVLKDAPLKKDADRAILSADFKRHLADKYNLKYDEASKAVDLFDKTNPDVPALNKDGNAKVKMIDEAKEFFTPRGAWETDMRDRKPDGKQGSDYKAPQNGFPQPQNDLDPVQAQNKAREEYFAKQD